MLLGPQCGVDAREKPLGSRFFVTGGAVDLPGEPEVVDELGLQGMAQVLWVQEIVLDGVARPGDVRVLETGNGAHGLDLHIEGQAGADAIGVELVGVQPFRLHEDLVRVFVREAVHLVLDGGAVTGSDALDVAGEHGRTIQPATDDLMSLFRGPGDETATLLRVLRGRTHEGHGRPGVVAPLFLHHGEIHGLAVDARRRARLEPAHVEGQFAQALREANRCLVPGATAGLVLHAQVDHTAQEGAGGQDHGPGMEADAGLGDHAPAFVALDDQVLGALLEKGDIRMILQHLPDGGLVQDAVRLRTGSADSRSFTRIQGAELDTRTVRGMTHGPAQRIDLLDQMALADTPDGRVAGHLAQCLDVVRQQQGA